MIIPDIINDIKINKIVNKKTLINLLVIFSISNISLDKKNEEIFQDQIRLVEMIMGEEIGSDIIKE